MIGHLPETQVAILMPIRLYDAARITPQSRLSVQILFTVPLNATACINICMHLNIPHTGSHKKDPPVWTDKDTARRAATGTADGISHRGINAVLKNEGLWSQFCSFQRRNKI